MQLYRHLSSHGTDGCYRDGSCGLFIYAPLSSTQPGADPTAELSLGTSLESHIAHKENQG